MADNTGQVYPLIPPWDCSMPSNTPFVMPGGRRRRFTCFIMFLVLVPLIVIYRSSAYLAKFPYYLTKDLQERVIGEAADHSSVSNVAGGATGFPLTDSEVFCKPDECMQGSWVQRDPPFRSLASFRETYPPTHRGNFKICGSEEVKRDREGQETFRWAQEERMIQAANWVWKPTRGRMRDWDATDFVVRLLQSPGGLIFSGDSITRQHFQWLEYALARAGIFITEDPLDLPSYSHKRLHQFILRPGHPMTIYLQERAGVPDSRLQRPIYTKIDNHILIGEKEIRRFTAPLGAKENFQWLDIFDYFEDWEIFVRNAAERRTGEENVSKDTILVLNTGAHWSRGSWYMLPKEGSVDEQQLLVTTAFKEMIKFVTTRLNPIPRLSIYYRATAPAHPACCSSPFYKTFRVNSTMPFPSSSSDRYTRLSTDAPTLYTDPHSSAFSARLAMSDIRQSLEASTLDSQQKVVRQRWDWDRLEAHNAEWKLVIDSIMNVRKPKAGSRNGQKAKWFYMDIWDMALQRRDAHTQNLVDPLRDNYDCLHWCVPNVVEQWTEYLNHLVFWDERWKE